MVIFLQFVHLQSLQFLWPWFICDRSCCTDALVSKFVIIIIEVQSRSLGTMDELDEPYREPIALLLKALYAAKGTRGDVPDQIEEVKRTLTDSIASWLWCKFLLHFFVTFCNFRVSTWVQLVLQIIGVLWKAWISHTF